MHQQISLGFLPNLIGTPYDEKDCWDIVKEFYLQAFNINLSKFDIIPQDRKKTEKQMDKASISFKKIEQPRTGDIILFKVMGHNAHVGIYLNNRSFLHTKKKIGCVIEQFQNWEKRIQGFYRWPSLD